MSTYTTKQASEILGISVQAVRNHGKALEVRQVKAGTISAYVWTDADIQMVRDRQAMAAGDKPRESTQKVIDIIKAHPDKGDADISKMAGIARTSVWRIKKKYKL